jgi:hypothetical protein
MTEAPKGNLAGLAGVFKHLLHLTLPILVFALLALYVLSVPLGLELFLFENLSSNYPPTYAIKVGFFGINMEVALGFVFTLLVSVYALCFVLAWKQGTELHTVVRSSFSKPIGLHMKNFLFALPVLTSLTYIAVDSIHALQESHGIPIGEPPLPEDPLLAFFGLCLTPLTEEITYRILPLGVFLTVRLLTLAKDRPSSMTLKQRLKICFTAFLSPDDAKGTFGLRTVEDSGLWKGIGTDEWVMILFTTVFFAFSHYFFTSTWDVGKIASTFVQGLVMGLSYVIYGIQAPILLHWLFNCHLYTYALTRLVHPNLSFLSFLNEKLTLGLGILGAVWAVYWGVGELVRTGMLSFGTLRLSAQKAKTGFIAKGNELLPSIRRLGLFDVVTVILTLVVLIIRLSIVNVPSPQAGEKYFETGLVFDESYYVKAARKMLMGESSNHEHPPLTKVLIMLGIALLGDNPLGWRIFPVIMSSLSIVLIYRTALLLCGNKLAAFGSSLLFATDVMAFNIGQIGMLDGSSLVFVLAGTTALLKERHDLGGFFFGLATLCKLSAVFAAAGVIFFLFIAGLTGSERSRKLLMRQVRVLGRAFFIVLVTFLIGLWIYDAGFQVFNNNPLGHITYMYSYHGRLKYENGDDVILPLEWISPLNPFTPVPYHVTTAREVSGGIVREYHPIAYYGIYTPLWWSIWLVMPIGLIETVRRIHKKERQGIGLFAISWISANFFPFALLAYLMQRWVYPFYFYMALPGLYIGLSHCLTHSRQRKAVLASLTLVSLIWFLIWFPAKPRPIIDLLLLLGLPA